MKTFLSEKDIAFIIQAGGTAPSGGNIQPWKVRAYKNKIELFLHPERSQSFLDVEKFASFFSLGSFAENVCIAAESLGFSSTINIFDYKNDTTPLATITITGKTEAKPHQLFSSVYKRHTNRNMHEGQLLSQKIIDELQKTVTNFNTHYTLSVVSSYEKKKAIADILGKADAIRTIHTDLFTQMMKEIRWNKKAVEQTRDGIDIVTLELPANVEKMLGLLRKFPFMRNVLPRKALENQAKPLLIGSSHLCCLSMKDKPTAKSLFLAGQVTQRLWLEVTQRELAFHPWTVLPFFVFRARFFPNTGFTKEEEQELLLLDKQIKTIFAIPQKNIVFFVFRLSTAKPASAKALRLDWKQYTEVAK